MRKAARGTIELTDKIKKWYNRKGYTITGETLRLGTDEEYVTYVVFKGDWTRPGTVRDCGDHYIYAGYASYDRIDKTTLEITKDVEDE